MNGGTTETETKGERERGVKMARTRKGARERRKWRKGIALRTDEGKEIGKRNR